MKLLDQRQQVALVQTIERTKRKTTDINTITLCDLALAIIPLRRQPSPLTPSIPPWLTNQIQAHINRTPPHILEHASTLLITSDEVDPKRMAAFTLETLTLLRPDKIPGQNQPDKMDKIKPPDKIPTTSPIQKQATHSRGRPPSKTPSAEAERKRDARARKKAALDQILKGTERKK